jgi:hypothetical protein
VEISSQGIDYKLPNAYAVTPLTRTCYIKDVKSNGVNGGASTTSYTQRVLNTLSGDTSFVSLTTNRFTLPAGKYNIKCECPAFQCAAFRAKLVKDPSGTPSDEILGSNGYSNGANPSNNYSFIAGAVEISASTTFEIQQKSKNVVSSGLGEEATLGDNEIYTQVTIEKIL